MVFRYSTLGLTLESRFEIPEFFYSPNHGELFASVSKGTIDLRETAHVINDVSAQVHWLDYGKMEVSNREITYDVTSKFTDNLFYEVTSGEALSFFLGYNNVVSLHGSCVSNLNQDAVAFLGDSGMGKSTTAAMLVDSGYSLLTDDLLPIYDKQDHYRVYPAAPEISLYKESFYQADKSLTFQQNRETLKNKAIYRTKKVSSPSNLKAICVLQKGEDWHLKSLSSTEAFPHLFRNISLANWSRYFKGDLLKAMNKYEVFFKFCVKLIEDLDFYVLVRPEKKFNKGKLIDTVSKLLAL